MSISGSLQFTSHELPGDAVVIEFHGEWDLCTSPRAKEELLRLLSLSPHRLLINLRHLLYLDSTALGTLMGIQRRAREQGGEVQLIAPTAQIRRILDITRLSYAFTIYANEDEALQPAG